MKLVLQSLLRTVLALALTNVDSFHSPASVAELTNLFSLCNCVNVTSARLEDNLGQPCLGFLCTVP